MRIASCLAAGMGFWVTTGVSGRCARTVCRQAGAYQEPVSAFPRLVRAVQCITGKKVPRWQGSLIARTNRAMRLAFAYCALTAVGSVGSKLIR